MKEFPKNNAIKILLADDDTDDRIFFERALINTNIPSQFASVRDGEQLIEYLNSHLENLPEVLFLDLSMPRKTGFECLTEIRENNNFDAIHIVMFSTSYTKDTGYEQGMIETLLQNGAQNYIRKPNDLHLLQESIHKVLTEIATIKSNT